MKQITFILLTLVIYTSCSNDKTSTADNGLSKMDSLKQNFIPIFKGVWVLTDYIKAIEQTKSPLKAANKLQGVVTMIIDAKNNADSVVVGASWNNHEGYNFTTYFIAGQNLNSLKTNIPDYNEKTNFYELGHETINTETFLVLYHYTSANKLIDKKGFTKVAEKQHDNNASWGLQYIVNEKLFSGSYYLIDSLNIAIKIQFNSDGSLTGLNGFKTFSISTDFVAPGPDDEPFDAICFNQAIDAKPRFEFKFNSDTVLLKQEHLHYKLVRQ